MKKFTNTDLIDYYDQTEVHYRMFWELEKSMGLHYGVWDDDTKNIQEAVLNLNQKLMKLGEIKSGDMVLDAGCGVGGSSIYLAKKLGCKATGITLSGKQVATATELAKKNGVGKLCDFQELDYTNTGFEDASFDVVWAIESIGSAPDKGLFFKEMKRILKPNGRMVMADTLKPQEYDIAKEQDMQMMLNGWAISDILSVQEMKDLGMKHGFTKVEVNNVSEKVKKSVSRFYFAGLAGMIGTKIYNLFKNATPFSKIHYTTGLAQKKAYDKGKWGYYLVKFSFA